MPGKYEVQPKNWESQMLGEAHNKCSTINPKKLRYTKLKYFHQYIETTKN